jgi:hypothetical protein
MYEIARKKHSTSDNLGQAKRTESVHRHIDTTKSNARGKKVMQINENSQLHTYAPPNTHTHTHTHTHARAQAHTRVFSLSVSHTHTHTHTQMHTHKHTQGS